MPFSIPEIVTADEAVTHVHSGMTLAINTMAATSYPNALSSALYDRFHATGDPVDLCFWGSTAQAMHALDALTEHLARCEGMFSKVVMGHWVTTPTFVKQAAENKIAAYNFPHLPSLPGGRQP